MPGLRIFTLLALSACGRFEFERIDGLSSSDGPLGEFGTPVMIDALAHPLTDDDPTLTGDLLEMYFASERIGAAGGYADIYVSKRNSTAESWGAPINVLELNTSDEDQSPGVSADGLEIYFSSRRPAAGNSDIWRATRLSRSDTWSPPVKVVELSSSFDEFEPQPDPSGLRLVMYRHFAGGRDVLEAKRMTTDQAWGYPEAPAVINTTFSDRSPCLMADGLEIWFASDRAGPTDVHDLYRARRPSLNEPFEAPQPVTSLNTSADEDDPWISADGHTLVFMSTRSGNPEIYEVTR